MAGAAIWLALPSQGSVGVAKASAVSVKAAAMPAPLVVEETETPAAQNADELRRQAGGAEAAPTVTASVEPEPLPQADPRWPGAASKQAAVRKVTTHSIVAQDGDEDAGPLAVSAFAADEKAASAGEKSAKAASNGGATALANLGTRPGKALRSVTMRAKPSSRGGVLGTVPGGADVSVVSCDSWCEIVYDGKRGFVYRNFLKNRGG